MPLCFWDCFEGTKLHPQELVLFWDDKLILFEATSHSKTFLYKTVGYLVTVRKKAANTGKQICWDRREGAGGRVAVGRPQQAQDENKVSEVLSSVTQIWEYFKTLGNPGNKLFTQHFNKLKLMQSNRDKQISNFKTKAEPLQMICFPFCLKFQHGSPQHCDWFQLYLNCWCFLHCGYFCINVDTWK